MYVRSKSLSRPGRVPINTDLHTWMATAYLLSMYIGLQPACSNWPRAAIGEHIADSLTPLTYYAGRARCCVRQGNTSIHPAYMASVDWYVGKSK